VNSWLIYFFGRSHKGRAFRTRFFTPNTGAKRAQTNATNAQHSLNTYKK